VKTIGYGISGFKGLNLLNSSPIHIKTLQQAILKTAPLNKCIDTTPMQIGISGKLEDVRTPTQTDPSVLCAQTAPGISGCYGDSGGPLFIEGNTPELVGVVSFGPYMCNKFNPATPSTSFANVSALYPWIVAATNRGLAAVRK
jgi:secreted trypsin-like serine protease